MTNEWTGESPRIYCEVFGLRYKKNYDYDFLSRIIDGFDCDLIDESIMSFVPLYDKQKLIRENRLSLVFPPQNSETSEPWMRALKVGMPVVTVGKAWVGPNWPYHLITSGHDGFVSNNLDELRYIIKSLLNDIDLARRIGYNGQELSRKLTTIKEQE